MEPTINAERVLDPENFSFPHGTHLCAVEVDTETGRPTIRKYVAVDDIGNVINPLIVEGQVHGGLAQGIAQALYEEAVYDADGNLVTGTMVDYLVPAAPDLPEFTTDRTETPATSNPLGVKGVGEAGTIASTPAVVDAVVDAVRHLGVQDIRMPTTPERVWRAINRRGSDGGERAAEGTIAYGGPQTATTAGGADVIPPEFDYLQPHSVDEAVTELGRAGEDAKVLAGGQSLLPLLRLRLAYPTALVDLGGVGELRGIRRDGDELVIGAMTTHHEVLHDPLVRRALPGACPGHRHGRRPGGPAPGHVRRRARARRPGRGPAGGGARPGRDVRHRGGRRPAPGPGVGVLLRLPGDGAGAGRGAGRDPGAGARPGAGAARTRSSTGSPRPGRSSAWPRW